MASVIRVSYLSDGAPEDETADHDADGLVGEQSSFVTDPDDDEDDDPADFDDDDDEDEDLDVDDDDD